MKKYTAIARTEICERIRELSVILDGNPHGEEWESAFNERDELLDVLDRFDLNAFYEGCIDGKAMGEIDSDDWERYSDWHLEVCGIRPRMP